MYRYRQILRFLPKLNDIGLLAMTELFKTMLMISTKMTTPTFKLFLFLLAIGFIYHVKNIDKTGI